MLVVPMQTTHLASERARLNQVVVNSPAMVDFRNVSILITDSPHFDNTGIYIKQLKQMNVRELVRTCDLTYDEVELTRAGITVHALEFPHDSDPDSTIIDAWMNIVDRCESSGTVVGVHCVVGLGRAPVLAAIALIEKGVNNSEAVVMVRSKRRGALNRKQVDFLMQYRRKTGKRWAPPRRVSSREEGSSSSTISPCINQHVLSPSFSGNQCCRIM